MIFYLFIYLIYWLETFSFKNVTFYIQMMVFLEIWFWTISSERSSLQLLWCVSCYCFLIIVARYTTLQNKKFSKLIPVKNWSICKFCKKLQPYEIQKMSIITVLATLLKTVCLLKTAIYSLVSTAFYCMIQLSIR